MNTFQLSPIKAIELAAAKIPDSISLAQGIPSFNTPKPIIDFVVEQIQQGRCDKYSLTTGLRELREEISLALGRDNLRYDPESEILVTAGSIEAITASILSCTSPGDEVLIPSPTYASYLGAIRLARAIPTYVLLDEENNFDFHVEAIEQAISRRTRAILYCAPNNPTGTLYSEKKTLRLLELAEKNNLKIIVDEVYKDFYFGNQKHFSPATVSHARSRVIRVCSFSKAYAMTGWRIAFLHCSKENLASILKFHDAMVTCAPVASQYAAIAAIRYGDQFLDLFRGQYKQRRDYAISRLERLSHIFDFQVPQATYFVFPRVKDTVPNARDSNKLAYDILEKTGVALVPGIAFGPSGESHLRINFGRELDGLTRGFDRLDLYFNGQLQDRASGVAKARMSNSSSPIKKATITTLAHCAKFRLFRHKPLIIGIVGFAGKTTFKRIIAALLATHLPTRAAPLSHNTESGLSLAVLGINPQDFTENRLNLSLKLASSTLLDHEKSQVLVLEYGIRSKLDAEALCSIAKPDWVVLCGLEMEPGAFSNDAIDGVRFLLSTIPAERIIWCRDDNITSQLDLRLDPDLATSTSIFDNNKLKLNGEELIVSREFVGDYAKLAASAAAILAYKLGVPTEKIRKFVSTQL